MSSKTSYTPERSSCLHYVYVDYASVYFQYMYRVCKSKMTSMPFAYDNAPINNYLQLLYLLDLGVWFNFFIEWKSQQKNVFDPANPF